MVLSHSNDQEAEMNETPTLQTLAPATHKQSHAVAIISIIATAIVLLACIGGCTAVLMTAVLNLR
jgi:hypothetical protein